jgi:DNA-binding transcriptional LysR family regulator
LIPLACRTNVIQPGREQRVFQVTRPNLKNVDLNLLVIFEAVYAAGNISHASVQLGMSQPAVSNALARLRDLVGDPMFVRGKSGVSPTARAESLIGPVRDALGLIRLNLTASGEFDPATYKRTFRIGASEALEPLVMPALCREVDASAPGVSIESHCSSQADLAAEVLSGRFDIAVIDHPVGTPDIQTYPLFTAAPVVVARKQHPAIAGTLTEEVFRTLGHVVLVSEASGHGRIEHELASHRLSRRRVYRVSKLWSIAQIVERTDLLGILPRRFAEEAAVSFDIAIYEAPVPLSPQHFFMVWNVKSAEDLGHKWLRETMIKSVMDGWAGTPPVMTADKAPDIIVRAPD